MLALLATVWLLLLACATASSRFEDDRKHRLFHMAVTQLDISVQFRFAITFETLLDLLNPKLICGGLAGACLQAFKQAITSDPDDYLSGWSGSPCSLPMSYNGVQCTFGLDGTFGPSSVTAGIVTGM